jgi:hypothetical protein
MTKPEVVQLLKWNSILWVTAMVLPSVLSMALATTRFPWQIVLPLLLTGPLLASNGFITRAAGESPTDGK